MAYFSNTEELLEHFGSIKESGFTDPITLQDRKVGFSIKRRYPENIRYKPARGQKTGEPDNIAVIWVTYTHPEESRKEIHEKLVPLRIRVANMSQYLSKHWDYDYEDSEDDCPSKASVEASAATPKPLDLEYPCEYFYDHTQDRFVDKNGSTVTGVDILERVFDDHCKTVHLLWGLKLRTKLYLQDRFSGVLGLLVSMLTWILKHLFGRTLEDDDALAGTLRIYKTESLKKYDADTLNIFGYKASKHVVVLFCAIVVLFTCISYLADIKIGYFPMLDAVHYYLWHMGYSLSGSSML